LYFRFVLKAFHSNRPFVLVLIPVLVVIFFVLNYNTGYHRGYEELRLGIWGSYKVQSSLLLSVFSMSLTIGGGILLNGLYNKNEFSERNNYLPALLYVLFLSFFSSFYFLDGLAIAQIFLILTVRQLLNLSQKEDGRRIVFNTALFFGIAGTFFPVLLLGTPVLFFLIWINRPFLFRESMLIIVGLLLPIIYVGAYIYIFRINIGLDDLNSSSKEIFKVDMWALIGGASLIFLAGLKRLLNKINVSSIRFKKIFRLLLLLTILLLALLLIDVFTYRRIQVLSLLLIPLSLVLPYGFGEKKPSLLPSVLFYIVLTFAVSKFFIPFNDLAF